MADYALFKEGIENEDNIYKIMDWINRCRTYVSRQPDIKSDEDKAVATKDFTDAWEQHYKANKTFYQSSLYRKAIVYNGVRKNEMNITIGLEKIDLNKFFLASIMNGSEHPLIKDPKEKQIDMWEEYWTLVETLKKEPVDGEKISTKILELIEISQMYYTMDYYINPILEDSDEPEEVKRQIQEEVSPLVAKIHEYVKNDDFEGIYNILYDNFSRSLPDRMVAIEPVKHKKMELYDIFETFDIKGTRWNNYESNREKNIDVDFFYNIGILLSLDAQSMDSLLQLHGYSLTFSWTKRDRFLKQCFEIGLDQTYIKELGRQKDLPLERKYYNIDSTDNVDRKSTINYLNTIHNFETKSTKVLVKDYKEALKAIIKKMDSSIHSFEIDYEKKIVRLDLDIKNMIDEKTKSLTRMTNEILKYDKKKDTSTVLSLSEQQKRLKKNYDLRIHDLKTKKNDYIKNNTNISYHKIFGKIGSVEFFGGKPDKTLDEWKALRDKLKKNLY